MTAEATPLDSADEAFSIGGDAADGQKSKYDFEGNYAVEITDIVLGQSAKGLPKFVVTLVGQEGPALGLVFTDHQPEFKTAEMNKQLGISKNAETGKLDFKKSQVVGKQLVAKFKREEYQGKWSARVQGYAPLGTSTASAAASDDIPF